MSQSDLESSWIIGFILMAFVAIVGLGIKMILFVKK